MIRVIMLIVLSLVLQHPSAKDDPCIGGKNSTNVSDTLVENSVDGEVVQICEAITKSGLRCKRKAAAGEHYCWQHLKQLQKKEPAAE